MARKLIVLDCEGVRVLEASDLAQLDKLVKGRAAIAIIEGDVVALGTLELREGEGAKAAAQTTAQTAPAQPGEAEGRARKVIAVLDQMFRGYYADVIEREAPYAEVHEVAGRGVQETLRVSEKRYLEPASDDFDVLRLVSRLASSGVPVLFFTGDKRLASQAQALGLQNLRVLYMPPSEFPGKESVAEAMINEIKRASKA